MVLLIHQKGSPYTPMDFQQNQAHVSEVLDKAQEYWIEYYGELQNTRPTRLFVLDAYTTLFGRVLSGTGSVVSLFPNTNYETNDFRCWRGSVDEAWNDDWYNVGADLYGALSKAQIELNNVRSTEINAAIPTTP